MASKGPLITLLGGGALAVALLIASANAATAPPAQDPVLAGDNNEAPTEAPPEGADEVGEEDEQIPADDPAEDAITYVGYVDGGGLSVAILLNGDEVTAYVCNGAEIESWMSGTAVNGLLEASNEAGDVLVADYDDARATGETTVSGQTYTFTDLEGVRAPEGLYRFADSIIGGAEVEGGWIILPDGTQIGVLTIDGVPQAAPPVDTRTSSVVIDGYRYLVEQLGDG